MKRLLTTFLALGLIAGSAFASAAEPDDLLTYDARHWKTLGDIPVEHSYAPDHLLITLQRGVVEQFRSPGSLSSADLPELHQLNLEQGYSDFRRIVDHEGILDQAAIDNDLDLYYLVEFSSEKDIETLISIYKANPLVADAWPDYIVTALLTPNDTYYPNQWAHNNTGQAVAYGGGYVGTPDCDIDSPQAWDISTGGSSVTIAIVDTGVDLDHSEFSGRIAAGYDFVNNDNNATDDEGHGTACAGLAAARGNNSSGVAGVAWNSMIMPIKVLNQNGSGYTSDIVDGVNWARNNGADVISMSLGGGGYDASFNSAITTCYNNGVIVVSAAGNDNSSTISYPAAYSNSMAIGALSPCNTRKTTSSCDGEYWWGSNYGTGLDVMSPGTRLHTTSYTGGYMSDMNGTSGATPQVAGAAALIMSVNPSLSAGEVWDVINNSADDMDAGGWDSQTGYGRLNAHQALILSGGGTDPNIYYSSHVISDANGQLDPGETVNMDITLHNAGAEATGVSLTLSESSPYVGIGTNYQYYGTIAAGGDDTNGSPFVITADPSTPVGTTVTINMSISASGYSNSDSFDLVIGTPPEFTECNDTPYSIPDDDPTGINSTIYLSQDVDILDLEVYVNITHTYQADLLVTVTSPGGTTVNLHNRSGGSANNIIGWYDSELTPDGPGSLADFNGENTVGTWTLHVDDNWAQDTGTLNEWCLWISGEGGGPENTPPVVGNIPNQSIYEGSSFTQINLNNYVTDAETADADILWTYAGNVDLGVSIVNQIATINIPDPDWNGLEEITFTATDEGGLQDSDPATFWVQGVNDPPVVGNIPGETIEEGETFALIYLDNYVSDLEDPDASIAWTYSGNSDLSVNITNRVATISYSVGWTGSEEITFTAYDTGGLFDSDAAIFTVEVAPNTPPVVGYIPNQSITEGGSFDQINLNDYVEDTQTPDVDIIWSYEGNVDLGVEIVNQIATILIPHPDWNGLETITFTATDEGGLEDSDPASFWVQGVNDAPVVADIPDQEIDAGDDFFAISLNSYVTDVETLPEDIIWTTGGEVDLTVDIIGQVATVSYPEGWFGAETIIFTATDEGGLQDEDEATFTVLAPIEPVDDLTITWLDPDILLEWSPRDGAIDYTIYRMLEPYDIENAVLVQTTADSSLTLTGEGPYLRAFYFVTVNY